MADKPILFKKEMYEAILDGRKTQTRRIIRNQMFTQSLVEYGSPDVHTGKWIDGLGLMISAPYKVGDRIWAKEPFKVTDIHDEDRLVKVNYAIDDTICSEGWFQLTEREWDKLDKWKHLYKGKSSLFMFKSLARLWLEVTGVRVERLQDISELDALSEGCVGKISRVTLKESNGNVRTGEFIDGLACDEFRDLWDSINKDHADWNSNPWVWVIEFKEER